MTTKTVNPIVAAAKSAARTAKIRQSYGLKKAAEAKATARATAIQAFYKKKAQTRIIAEAVAKKVADSYKGKGRSVRTPASSEVVAG